MGTTTIRVDTETHRRLSAISRVSEKSLIDVLREATDALERERFAALVSAQLDGLREDAEGWAEYLAGADVALRDGIA